MYYLLSFYLFMLSLMYFMMSVVFLSYKFNIMLIWSLIKVLGFNIEFLLYLDWMSFMFLSVVSLISSMVFLYSLGYMEGNKYINRFMLLVLIFYVSMKFMIISPNMFSILLGWDGLGVSSYCLIIFYQNKKSLNSGFMTILMNRIGDISILVMIGFLLSEFSLSFMFLWEVNYFYLFFILLASITKSAQIPFSYWLPLAMAAPTPVSSLVHSSTLVTAGVYLLIRFSYILNGWLLIFLSVISCWTMFMASISAIVEFDLKKIIALSTLSQLGLMIMSITLGLIDLSFFHLLTHAMFKSLLFLCSGIIIHNYYNNQDIRLISFISGNLPLVSLIFSVSSLSLCGIPFLSGFYSKDLLIEFYNMNTMNMIMFNLMYISMMNTVVYSVRLVLYVSVSPLYLSNNENFMMNNLMNYSLYLLFMMTVFYGSIMNWLVFSSLNMIILNSFNKFMIYKLLGMGKIFASSWFYVKLMFNMKYYIFFNYMWGFQLMWKKNKINMFKLNNMMIMLKEFGWIEKISGKKLILYFIQISKMQNLNYLSFSVIVILVSYMLILLYLFN